MEEPWNVREWVLTCRPDEAAEFVRSAASKLEFTFLKSEETWTVEVPKSFRRNQYAASLQAKVSPAELGANVTWKVKGKGVPLINLNKIEAQLPPGTIYDHGVAQAAGKVPGKFLASAELEYLPSILGARENVHVIGVGTLKGKFGIAAVTDTRLIFLEKGLIRRNLVEFSLGAIEATDIQRKLGSSKFIIQYSGTKAEIEDIPFDQAQSIVDKVNELRADRQSGDRVASSSTDPMELIRRMAQLRDEGILTEDEFQAKKAQLLNSI